MSYWPWSDHSKQKASTQSARSNEPLPFGLKILAEGVNPVLDIVAVHGLNGHREKTWTVDGVNWLCDLLPTDIPNARICSWGYDADTHGNYPISAQYLHDHATTLISDLCMKRSLTNVLNICTVISGNYYFAKEEGRLVLGPFSLWLTAWEALIHSASARRGALEEHESIKLSTYGIMFMGTPHQGGSGVRLGELMLNVASIFVPTNNVILQHLERDSEWLQLQLCQYAPISRDFVTKFAYEIFPTPVAVGKTIMVVPRASAVVPGDADAESIAIPANHIDMVKFSSHEDGGYEKVSGHLRLLANKAPEVIAARWAEAMMSVGDIRALLGDVANRSEHIR